MAQFTSGEIVQSDQLKRSGLDYGLSKKIYYLKLFSLKYFRTSGKTFLALSPLNHIHQDDNPKGTSYSVRVDELMKNETTQTLRNKSLSGIIILLNILPNIFIHGPATAGLLKRTKWKYICCYKNTKYEHRNMINVNLYVLEVKKL